MKTFRYIFQYASLMTCLLIGGCSGEKNPPIPKSEPQLILEIFESGRKKDYKTMELKVKKLQAINPTSIFLVELENNIQQNRLFLELNKDLAAGNFVRADESLRQYELEKGTSDELKAARAKIRAMEEFSKLIDKCNACRDSAQMVKYVQRMKELSKTVTFSENAMNFLKKQESMILRLRAAEYDAMLFGLYSDAVYANEEGLTGAPVLSLLFTLRAPDSRETKHLMQLLTTKYEMKKTTRRKD